jgi:hypothetical protein
MGTAAWARRGWGVVLASSALAACSGRTAPSAHGAGDASVSDAGTTTDAPSGSDAGADVGAGADAGDDAYECASATDCPKGRACDTSTSRCTESCDATQPCNGGCCAGAPDGGANGTCQSGALETGCGHDGRQCLSCPAAFTAGTGGNLCEPVAGGGVCGCANATGCPGNSAGCDKTSGVCDFSCSYPALPCLAGCCGHAMCEPGTSGTACGTAGSCADCTGNPNGSACVSGVCGCQVQTDCPAEDACDPTTGRCAMQ